MGATGKFGVLVIEDNDIFRQLVVEMLHDYPHLEVYEASSGEEALEKFEAYRPDVVFVDLELGDANGFSIIEKIRSQADQVIIAVLTSFDLPEYKGLAQKYHVNHFLTKGISTQEDIRTVLSTVSAQAAP